MPKSYIKNSADTKMNPRPVPVTLLTGFLGSGKSTLLSLILCDLRFRSTAVVVNEFGEVGLDGDLIQHSQEQFVEMTSGCLCCTIRGDIRETLLDLHHRCLQGQIPMVERLVVETTGLADPAPVLHTLMTDATLAGRYMLNGVVTTIDTINGAASLARHSECVKQVAVADRIVLTKTDLAGDAASHCDLQALRCTIAKLNPSAPILDRNGPDFDYQSLFNIPGFCPASKVNEVQEWLNAEAYANPQQYHVHRQHNHEQHHDAHDVNRHGTDVQSFSLILEEPVAAMGFMIAIELLIANQGEEMLRVKGIVHIAEKPDNPAIINGVQHIFHPLVWLDKWPNEDRRTKIVFITRNISKETIKTFFKAWQHYDKETEERLRPQT